MYNLQNLPKHTARYVGTYAEVQALEVERLKALPESVKQANANSHLIGNVDGVSRCVNCEIGVWNAWKESC
jgi:hypothetical protein